MKYKISKELFEAASETKVDDIVVSNTHIEVYFKDSLLRVSVFEFFFKCKEFAYQQGYTLKSEINGCLLVPNNSYIGSDEEWFNADSEQQAVFDACTQILEWTKNGSTMGIGE